MGKRPTWRGGKYLTPQSLIKDPRRAFAEAGEMPAWLNKLEFIEDPDTGRIVEAEAVIGQMHRKRYRVNVYALAALWEMTRPPGVTINTNSNHGRSPRTYARLHFAAVKGHNIDIRPVLYGAPAGMATKPLWVELEDDLGPESTRLEPDPHTGRASRADALKHVADAAQSHALDPQAFLANLSDLFAALDGFKEPPED